SISRDEVHEDAGTANLRVSARDPEPCLLQHLLGDVLRRLAFFPRACLEVVHVVGRLRRRQNTRRRLATWNPYLVARSDFPHALLCDLYIPRIQVVTDTSALGAHGGDECRP